MEKIDKSFDIVMYNIKEVAAILEVTTRTVHTYLKDGRLKGQKVGGKWKITKENLEAFCNGR